MYSNKYFYHKPAANVARDDNADPRKGHSATVNSFSCRSFPGRPYSYVVDRPPPAGLVAPRNDAQVAVLYMSEAAAFVRQTLPEAGNQSSASAMSFMLYISKEN